MIKTDSRDAILARIKANKPVALPLPTIPMWEVPGSPMQNFIAHLKGFDGDYRLFATRAQAEEWLRQLVAYAQRDMKVFSAIPDIEGNVAMHERIAEMNGVHVCLAEALMAVGETGSLLVDTRSLGSPAGALLSTNLFLLIDRSKMVPSIQEAYTKFDIADARYSAFFSGPSATADIEAVHITGAQGEISLIAVMYGCSPEDMKEADEIMDRLPKGTPLGQPDAPALKLRRPTDPAKGQDSV